MRKRLLWLIGSMFLCCGCFPYVTAHGQQSEARLAVGSTPSPSPVDFTIDITLSDRAKKKLTESKETVIVAAYLSGTAKKGALKRYAHDGEVGLGDIDIETAPGESAKFKDVKPKEDAFRQTDKQSPQILINVFSGRKSSKDNLIICDIYEGTLESIRQRILPISCALIEEHPILHTVK